MSKVSDILNRRLKPGEGPPSDAIQEELARTFFSQPPRKRKRTPRTLFLIVTIAACLAFAFVVLKSGARVFGPPAKKGVFFIKDGEPNKYLVRNVFFAGAAKRFSRTDNDKIVFVNSAETGWANFTVEFKEPLNMRKVDLLYTARGQTGDECVVLVFVDGNNRSYRMEKDISSALTAEWNRYAINLGPIGKAIDMGNITAIKFEFGSLTAENYHSATIFLKDLCAAKRRRVKWL